MSAVTLQITDRAAKNIRNSVHFNFSVYGMPHAVNAVPALHKRNIAERPHDIIFYGGKRTEAYRAGDVERRGVNRQTNPVSSDLVFADTYLISAFVKFGIGKLCMETVRIGNELNFTKFFLSDFMDRGDHCQGLLL